jgi:hypothetical protein
MSTATTAESNVVIAHASPIILATHVRSTLVQSSINLLRVRGHFDAYIRLLPAEFHQPVLGTIAASWLPIDIGLAHYRACDALFLDPAELIIIGEAVGDRIQGTFMRTLTQAVRGAGVSPWTLFKRFDRLWDRLLVGGSVQLIKVGPKDLAIEVRSARLPQFQYFRTAFCGVVRAGFKFVGVQTAYVKVSRWDSAADRFVMRAAWA